MVKTSLEVPEDLWRRFRIRAIEEGARLHQVLKRALEAYLRTPVPNAPEKATKKGGAKR